MARCHFNKKCNKKYPNIPSVSIGEPFNRGEDPESMVFITVHHNYYPRAITIYCDNAYIEEQILADELLIDRNFLHQIDEDT